jgi:hypothetical protein
MGNPAYANALYIGTIHNNHNDTGINIKTLTYNTTTSEINYYDNSGATKTFIIDHPVRKDKYLVHCCLEGPEVGVYYHGKNEILNNTSVTVYLPDYVDKFSYDFTVHITHIYDGKNKIYNVSNVINNQFNVFGENGCFYWIVYGKRDNVLVEPNKKDVILKGSGPYKWI